jgi:hypothetical protein
MRDGRQAYYLRVALLSGEVETLVEIHPGARNWYIPVRQGGTAYVAELGFFDRRGGWRGLVRSAEACTPADALADESHAEVFATVPQGLTFEKLQELVNSHMEQGETLLEAISRITGEGRIQVQTGALPSWTQEQKRLLAMLLGESLINIVGLGSDEIDRLLRKALQEKLHSEAASGLSARLAAAFGPGGASLFSPMGSSWSGQPFGARERGFSAPGARGAPIEGEGRLVAVSESPSSAYKRGDRVFHVKFGYGKVASVEGNKLTVAFDKAGEKKVIDSFVERADKV